jgi:hypothetical protein
MNDLTSSVWRTAYVAAILEADGARMTVRISDTRTAINERLNSSLAIWPHEHEARRCGTETCNSQSAAR